MLVAEDAEEYRQDHDRSHAHAGVSSRSSRVDATPEKPSVRVLASLISDGDPAETAVVLVDANSHNGIDDVIGTRLANYFPTTTIHAWDPLAEAADDRISVVGRLRTYRLSMDMPDGQAHDAWERATMLIHDRWSANVGGLAHPWAQLDEFYRGSNRRLVRNALWMVEQIGGHTWNTWGTAQDPIPPAVLSSELEPLERLHLMGFDEETAIAMALAEHEDWSRYFRAAGWKYGRNRDSALKIDNRLVDSATILANPDLLRRALATIADTLSALVALGYRSRPVKYDPIGQV
jgi:hypothetical protein